MKNIVGKEYRVVGRFGIWGEILYDLAQARIDLEHCKRVYPQDDTFHIEERDVEMSAWRVVNT